MNLHVGILLYEKWIPLNTIATHGMEKSLEFWETQPEGKTWT